MTDYKIEVDKLTKEIKKLKEDKDFVWTLWKRLQLSTPDVADAMSIVAQREKEKNAASLADLLEQINIKDERIHELSSVINSKEGQIESLAKSKDEYIKRCLQLENQCSDLTEKATKLDHLLSKQDDRNQRQVITAYEVERKELLNTISRLQSQITALLDEKNDLKLENVEQLDKIKNSDFLSDSICRLRLQLDDANVHMKTQEETIQLLRDQLEQNIRLERTYRSEDGYSSDRTEEYQSTRRRKVSTTDSQSVVADERPVTPIEDLNYKVDRLAIHMRHLQQCVSQRDPRQLNTLSRSRSTPPKRNLRNDNQKEENLRKIQFLTLKLTRTVALLTEEKKNSSAASDLLKKSNSRVQSMQLTIKQLRKQIEDMKSIEAEWKNVTSNLESDIERTKTDVRSKEVDINKLSQSAVNDASRIQELLNILEKTRYELTEKNIRSQQDENGDVERLKCLARQLESDKTSLEIKLSCLQSEFEKTKCSMQMTASQNSKLLESRPRMTKNKRVKILSKKPRRIASRKIKSMQSIFNHFGGVSGDDVQGEYNKDDEWEDENNDDEVGSEMEPMTTERTSASQTSGTSTGAKIARIASHNQRYRETFTDRDRRSLANEHHIYRINEARDKSPDKDAGNVGCTQCKTTKNRVASLQQQLKAMTTSRDNCKSKVKNCNRQLSIFHSDLVQAKARCERLVDAIKKQCGRIQVLMEERRQLLGNSEPQFSHEHLWKEIGIDTTDVASIAKAHLDEVSSQVVMVRDLHQELGKRDVQLIQVKEKLDRVERENSCKKKIIEDLRSKLQCLDGLKDRERTIVENKDKRCRDLEDSVSRLKTQLESLQTRFNVVLNERRKFEFEASNLSVKLEMAEKRNAELKQAKQILEIQLNKTDQESDGKLSEIISRSDLALDRLNQQVQSYKTKCSKYENLIVNLSRHLSDKSREIRRLIEFGQNTFRGKLDSAKKESHVASSLGYDFARNKAADILSLSTSEIDSLLNGHSNRDGMKKQKNNSSFNPKMDVSATCKSLLKKDSFEQDIQTLFVEELDKLVEIVVPSSTDSGFVSAS